MSTYTARKTLLGLAAALQRRYPKLRITECTGLFIGERLARQHVYFQGAPEHIIAAGLVTQKTCDWVEHAQLDSRRMGPTTEYGDFIRIHGASTHSGEIVLTLMVDEVEDGPGIREGVLRIDSQKMRHQVAALLKKAFALPRRTGS